MLCDATGATLTELTTATGKSLAFRRNSYAEASSTLGVDDGAAVLLADELKVGWPRLKVYRRSEGAAESVLAFYGHMAPLVMQAEQEGALQLLARSPFARLTPSTGGRSMPDRTFTQVDAGQIVANVLGVNNTLDHTGLAIGNVEPTKLRDITYPFGYSIGDATMNLSRMLDGFDFAERFADEHPVMAYLDILARQGGELPGVSFQYGAETLANVRAVSSTIAPPVNLVVLTGADGLTAVVSDEASRQTYGQWELVRSFPSISVYETLLDRAYSLLRPRPVQTVAFTPESNAPQPWGAYALGDTVGLYANRGAIQIDAQVRVNAFRVVVDDNGYEAVEVQDPATPDEESFIRAGLEVEVTTNV